MRAAAIFGLGTSPADLKAFQAVSSTTWFEGLPASSKDADAVVIFGGDGTIHRHLGALVRLGLPVLVAPGGSGNDFARALGVPTMRDSLRAWRNFESGKEQPRAIDVGLIRRAAAPPIDRYFCSVAGCGLDSLTARRANRLPRWLRAHGGYALALAPSLIRLPAYRMRITRCSEAALSVAEPVEAESGEAGSGGADQSRATLLAAFANTQFYGDGMRIAPRADPADGKLDICRIWTMNPLELLGMFPTVYFGQHLRSSKVEYSNATRVRLETEPVLDIYADGEFVCQTPAEISVAAGALRVIDGGR